MVERQVWGGVEGEQEIPPLSVTVSQVRMMMYAAATWNPYRLHWDSDYSKKQGFSDANVAGPVFGDYLAEMLVRWAGSPSCLRKLEYTNRAMSFPGDRLVFKGNAGEKWENEEGFFIRCRVWAENQEGQVLMEGFAVVSLSRSVSRSLDSGNKKVDMGLNPGIYDISPPFDKISLTFPDRFVR